jgi:omega-6 fatty acid desaturase (delta-12 desaturase)
LTRAFELTDPRPKATPLQTVMSPELERSRDAADGSGAGPRERAPWHDDADRYARPHLGRSLLSVSTSVVPFIALWALMYLALSVSYLLVLVLAVPTAGFLLRTYILFHDCAHGSLLKGRRASAWLGAVLGLIVFTPFAHWRREHVLHHATGSDLDRRGMGDVPTLTVAEYDERSRGKRLGYRLFRNPLIMFGLGPIYGMLLEPRWPSRTARAKIKRSIWGTDLAIVLMVGGLCWWLGWSNVLLVEAPLVVLAGGSGIWLFYVQHQFEGTYWERTPQWSYADAALRGSSYLRLPKILQFFTGNIGLHHVHHLNPKIPNYNLQRTHDESPIFRDVPAVSLWGGLRATRLKLWDEDAGRLVTWTELGARRGSSQTGQTGASGEEPALAGVPE